MAYDRNGRDDRPYRGDDQQRDYGRTETDHGRDYSDVDYRYSSARDLGDYEREAYGQRDEWRGQDATGGRDYYRGDADTGRGGRRIGVHGQQDRDNNRQSGGQGRQPQGYDPDSRGFIARASDELRSWVGDEDAERRREMDARRDERTSTRSYAADPHYQEWRNHQIDQFDRDYHEYRQENQDKFHNEFGAFRTERAGQRDLLNRVEEHAEVVGSDGAHVGTVDKVRGDRIILTKNDQDAGGRHHSIPSRWLQSADAGTVTLRKTAAEAKAHWRDEERQGQDESATFGGDRSQSSEGRQGGEGRGETDLNRSFPGTY